MNSAEKRAFRERNDLMQWINRCIRNKIPKEGFDPDKDTFQIEITGRELSQIEEIIHDIFLVDLD